jgi:hypothetical protein
LLGQRGLSFDQAVAAIEALAALDRRLCRRSFEERFTVARMVENYVRGAARHRFDHDQSERLSWCSRSG